MPSHDAPWWNDPEFDDDGHRFDGPLRDEDFECDQLREQRLDEQEATQ